MKDKKVIGRKQHENTNEQSCLTNSIAFYDEMISSVGKGRAVVIVYLDFSMAFDTVSHHIM